MIESERIIDLSNSDTRIPVPAGYNYAARDYFSKQQLILKSGQAAVVIDSVTFAIPLDSLCGLKSSDKFEGISLYPLSGSTDSVYVTKSIDIILSDKNSADEDRFFKFYSTGLVFTK